VCTARSDRAVAASDELSGHSSCPSGLSRPAHRRDPPLGRRRRLARVRGPSPPTRLCRLDGSFDTVLGEKDAARRRVGGHADVWDAIRPATALHADEQANGSRNDVCLFRFTLLLPLAPFHSTFSPDVFSLIGRLKTDVTQAPHFRQ